MTQKPTADRFLNRFVSKKLTCYLVGVIFFATGHLDSDAFVWLSGVYMGGQSLVDAAVRYRTGAS